MVNYLAPDQANRMLDTGFEPSIAKAVEQMDMPSCGVRWMVLFTTDMQQSDLD